MQHSRLQLGGRQSARRFVDVLHLNSSEMNDKR